MSLGANPLIGDWLGVSGDRLVVRSGKVDIGQRISTALAQIAHEELGVPLDRIEIAPVRTGAAPDEGITSGSNSLEQSGHALRCAAASLRRLLTAREDARLGGQLDAIPEAGKPTGAVPNGSLDIIALIDADVLQQPVDTAAPRLAPRNAEPRPPMRGLADMVRGQFVFVHDIDVPGMLHARVVRPPHALSRLVAVPQAAAQELAGQRLKLIRDGSFLAIAGVDEWQVVSAALRLAGICDWASDEALPEEDVFGQLTTSAARRWPVVDGIPQMAEVPSAPERPDLAARYERPFTMHGALAPSAAMARYSDGVLVVHTHSQGIYPLRDAIAASLDLPETSVELIHVPGSGCYGHNGADDAALEAALVAMAIPDTPVLLKWTRACEHGWEPYGSAMAVELAASVDAHGRIAAWSADAISATHRGRPRAGPELAGPSKLIANNLRARPVAVRPAAPNMNRHGGLHRNLDPAYSIPRRRLVKNLVDGLPHRTSALRCLGAAANVFAVESFMDEIAGATGRDPFRIRRAHLDDPRGLAVLERLEARAAARDKPAGGGRGIAYAQYKNAMARVGVCVDLSVDDAAKVHLIHATLVADAGRVVDGAGLRAQLEGGFVQAASWALYERVTWDRDGITSLDWESYPVIRIDDVPEVEVEIIDRPTSPSLGAGEAAPGPALGAIANAIHDAVGLRLRRLPFTPDAIIGAALSGGSG